MNQQVNPYSQRTQICNDERNVRPLSHGECGSWMLMDFNAMLTTQKRGRKIGQRIPSRRVQRKETCILASVQIGIVSDTRERGSYFDTRWDCQPFLEGPTTNLEPVHNRAVNCGTTLEAERDHGLRNRPSRSCMDGTKYCSRWAKTNGVLRSVRKNHKILELRAIRKCRSWWVDLAEVEWDTSVT
jgi:hypothetical protein